MKSQVSSGLDERSIICCVVMTNGTTAAGVFAMVFLQLTVICGHVHQMSEYTGMTFSSPGISKIVNVINVIKVNVT